MKIRTLLSLQNEQGNAEGGSAASVSLRRRLLVFLLILMFTMLSGILFLLLVLGVFRFDADEIHQLMQKELNNLSMYASSQFGGANVQASRMAERLRAGIEEFMEREELTVSDFHRNPRWIELQLKELLPVLLNDLDVTDCSGVFLTLDATVNPRIAGAENSKAGLYIRAIEPNIGSMGTETRYLLRGPSSLAGDGKMNLQARWDLEFNISDQPFWRVPIEAYAADPSLSLSRLVYWCAVSPVQGLDEEVMVCSVPVLAGDGSLLGVCGFEISQMNFMLRYGPNIHGFSNGMFLFSSSGGDNIRLEGALYSGNTTVYDSLHRTKTISRMGSEAGFSRYGTSDGSRLIGMEHEMRLYPSGSPFAGQSFSAILLLPQEEFDAAQNAVKLQFSLLLFGLVVTGVTASLYLSKRYMKPITDKLGAAGETGIPEMTNITEIDQFIQQIIKLRQLDSPLPDNLFEDFIARLHTLTLTERAVFQTHAEGKNADEAAKSMFIALSTLRKHNLHIYKKLGVSSQEELRLYISLLKRCGLMNRVFAQTDQRKTEI